MPVRQPPFGWLGERLYRHRDRPGSPRRTLALQPVRCARAASRRVRSVAARGRAAARRELPA